MDELPCAEKTDLMFDDRRTTQAKAICRPCPLRARCLATAIGREEPAGVWGGMTTRERQKIIQALEKSVTMFQVVSSVRSSRR